MFYITTQSLDPIRASPLVPIISFIVKGYSSEQHVAFNCHVLLVSFNMILFLSLALTLMTLNSKRLQAIYFLEYPSILVCLMFPHNYIQIMHLSNKYSEAMLFSHCVLLHGIISICPFTDNIHFDYLIKMVSPGFPTIKLLFSSY